MPPNYEFVKVPSVCVIQMTQALPLTGRKIIYDTESAAKRRAEAQLYGRARVNRQQQRVDHLE